MIQGNKMQIKTTAKIIESELGSPFLDDIKEYGSDYIRNQLNKKWISLDELITLIDNIAVIPKGQNIASLSKRELLSHILTMEA